MDIDDSFREKSPKKKLSEGLRGPFFTGLSNMGITGWTPRPLPDLRHCSRCLHTCPSNLAASMATKVHSNRVVTRTRVSTGGCARLRGGTQHADSSRMGAGHRSCTVVHDLLVQERIRANKVYERVQLLCKTLAFQRCHEPLQNLTLGVVLGHACRRFKKGEAGGNRRQPGR